MYFFLKSSLKPSLKFLGKKTDIAPPKDYFCKIFLQILHQHTYSKVFLRQNRKKNSKFFPETLTSMQFPYYETRNLCFSVYVVSDSLILQKRQEQLIIPSPDVASINSSPLIQIKIAVFVTSVIWLPLLDLKCIEFCGSKTFLIFCAD